ncbi:MFS transporter [Permianibacter aggregans]|uniref:Putative MFS family arabinose efflux permease n=1 Tax=Permianibacter aggregans TaxID=1510150 RepID=A0A4R6UM21_9GAMM|nr:MFS transporter [Permianibacter aggregans]QGX41046.1 MFS transporter [Permianibacter aggregans]TDQ48110.1 putative MFS family arabinose efflux permease [Permianibacter aggregans]
MTKNAGLLARLTFITASLGAGQTVLLSLVPVLLEHTGLNTAELGSLMALGTLSLMLAAPLWGWFSDRYGRRSVLRTGLLGYLLAQTGFVLVLLALADSWLNLNVGLMLLALMRLAYGLLAAGVYPACQAWACDTSIGGQPLKALATISSGSHLGRSLGPLLVLPLLPLAVLAPLLWLLLLPLLSLLLIWRAPEPAIVTPTPSPAADASSVPLRPLLLAFSLTAAIGQLQFLLGPLLGERFALSAEQASAASASLLVLVSIVTILTQVFIVRRLSELNLALRFGALLFAAGMVWLAWSAQAISFGLALVALAIGAALLVPAYSSQVDAGAETSQRGKRFGQLSLAHTAGYTLGFAVAGWWYQRWPEAPLAAAIAAAFLALLLAAFRPAKNASHSTINREQADN